MKFLCSSCTAKYQIADQKVAGRTLRMTCRRCGEEIVIRGDAPSVAAPAPVALRPITAPPAAPAGLLGADLDRQLSRRPAAAPEGWHVAIGDTPVGPISRAEVAHKLETGAATLQSLAWHEGFEGWKPIAEIPQLAALVQTAGPPPLSLRAGGPPPLTAAVSIAAPAVARVSMPAAVPAPAAVVSLPPSAPAPAAAVTPFAEDWGTPAPDTSPSQVTANPLLAGEQPQRQPPSYAVLFALAGFVAFILSATTIAGVHLLKDDPPPAPAAPAPEPAVQKQAQLAVPVGEPAEPEPEPAEEMVIDVAELPADAPAGARKPRAGSRKPRSSAGSKKKLTAEQKAMLERMGGGTGDIGGLKRTGGSRGGSKAGSGTVDAAALSKVVSRGKRSLKRCYESAMKSSGVTDTVRLDVAISVSPSGNVTKVKTTGNGIPGLDTCIERTVRAWRFPASGEGLETKFPLVFAPGS